jgi:hypothetical protein
MDRDDDDDDDDGGSRIQSRFRVSPLKISCHGGVIKRSDGKNQANVDTRYIHDQETAIELRRTYPNHTHLSL